MYYISPIILNKKGDILNNKYISSYFFFPKNRLFFLLFVTKINIFQTNVIFIPVQKPVLNLISWKIKASNLIGCGLLAKLLSIGP